MRLLTPNIFARLTTCTTTNLQISSLWLSVSASKSAKSENRSKKPMSFPSFVCQTGGQTGCSHRILQAAQMQENFRPPLVLKIILKGRIDRIGHGRTIGKSNRRDDYLAGRVCSRPKWQRRPPLSRLGGAPALPTGNAHTCFCTGRRDRLEDSGGCRLLAVSFFPVTLTPQNRSSTIKYYCLVVTNARE